MGCHRLCPAIAELPRAMNLCLYQGEGGDSSWVAFRQGPVPRPLLFSCQGKTEPRDKHVELFDILWLFRIFTCALCSVPRSPCITTSFCTGVGLVTLVPTCFFNPRWSQVLWTQLEAPSLRKIWSWGRGPFVVRACSHLSRKKRKNPVAMETPDQGWGFLGAFQGLEE